MPRRNSVFYLATAVLVISAVETGILLRGQPVAIIASLLLLPLVFVTSLGIGRALVFVFALHKRFYSLVGRPMMTISYWGLLAVGTLYCVLFPGLEINRDAIPQLAGIMLAPHPSAAFVGMAIGIRAAMKGLRIPGRSCGEELRKNAVR